MPSLTRKLGLTLAISLACSAIRVSTTQQSYEQYAREFAENVTVPKIVCQRQEGNRSSATCVLSKFEQSCNISLEVANGSVGRVARAAPFGKGRAIVLWSERSGRARLVRFRAIQLSSCSTASEATLAIGKEDSYLSWGVSLATYDATYDVFYVEQERRQYCKQSIDAASGQPIGKLLCIEHNFAPPFYTSYFPLEPHGSARPRGYVLLLPSFERTIDAWFLGPDDEAVRFASFSQRLPARRFAVSTSHSTITICHQQRLEANATLVNCTRFSIITGRKKQQTELTLLDGAKISEVFNLSDAGYLIALSKRSPLGCGADDAERLVKISKDNVTFFAVPRSAPSCDCAPAHVRTRMFENERRELCLASICNTIYGAQPPRNNVRTQCFSDRELSVQTFAV